MKKKTKKKFGRPKKRFGIPKKLRNDIRRAAIGKQTKNIFCIDKPSLIHLYWHVGLSQKQIGDIFGVATRYVSHKMHDFDISVRKGRPHKREHARKRVTLTSPNSYEQKIIDLCEKKHYPFVFVGNKYKVIENKSPDFIDTDGSKRIIECYAKYWHENDYEETRSKFFMSRGYRILFLSDDDLNVECWEDICIMKIDRFLEQKIKTWA
jgi:very-short-patch-repair endonuclease